MDINETKEALKSFLETKPEEMVSQLKIVTGDQLPNGKLYHMSKNAKLERFIPYVSPRTLEEEDRIFPRVSTAPTLAGCLMGYQSDLSDFHRHSSGRSLEGSPIKFRSGWYVYELDADVAVRPEEKLLPDVERTDEHWLLPFDKEHSEYRGKLAARFFYEAVTYLPDKDDTIVTLMMYVSVESETPVPFNDKVTLEKGFWRIKVVGLHNAPDWKSIPEVSPERITQMEYDSIKRYAASLLSLEDVQSASYRW